VEVEVNMDKFKKIIRCAEVLEQQSDTSNMSMEFKINHILKIVVDMNERIENIESILFPSNFYPSRE
jgi:hypothetical protein